MDAEYYSQLEHLGGSSSETRPVVSPTVDIEAEHILIAMLVAEPMASDHRNIVARHGIGRHHFTDERCQDLFDVLDQLPTEARLDVPHELPGYALQMKGLVQRRAEAAALLSGVSLEWLQDLVSSRPSLRQLSRFTRRVERMANRRMANEAVADLHQAVAEGADARTLRKLTGRAHKRARGLA